LPITLLMQAASSAAVVAPPVAAPFLLERLQLAPASVGLFVALIYLAAMFSSPLGAQCVRRFGPIRSSQFGLMCSAIGLACVAVPSVPVAALGAIITGIGYGPITPASSQMLSRTTALRHYALVFSIKQTGVPLGGVIVGLMVPPLLEFGGVTAAMLGTSLLCIAAALAAVPLRRPLDHDRDLSSAWFRLQSLIAPARFVIEHPILRRMSACSFVLSLVQVSFTAYLVTFLTRDWHWSVVEAGVAMAAAQVSGVVGRIGWGVLSDRWLGARPTILLLAIVMALCGISMLFLDAAPPAVGLMVLCLYGATAVGWNGVYLATVARVVTQAQAATATGGVLMFTFFGVVIGPPVFGVIGQAAGGMAVAFAALAVPLAAVTWALRKGDW
jgi:MFS family permease